MEYGLIGGRLGHSYSKVIHEMLCGYRYDLCPLPTEEEVRAFMTRRQFRAINVTIPYKLVVMEYCSYIDPHAKAINAVNTIVNRNGLLYGYNTDYPGFSYLCDAHGVEFKDRTVLILGTGGTHNTTWAVAHDRGAKQIYTVSRHPDPEKGELTYAQALTTGAQIIINTTPVGMYPNVGVSALDITSMPGLEAVIDVIYNPDKTELILRAEELGVPVAVGGLEMLVAQAVYAAEFFLDRKFEDAGAEIARVTSELRREQLNIALIGMPSSGKSTWAALWRNGWASGSWIWTRRSSRPTAGASRTSLPLRGRQASGSWRPRRPPALPGRTGRSSPAAAAWSKIRQTSGRSTPTASCSLSTGRWKICWWAAEGPFPPARGPENHGSPAPPALSGGSGCCDPQQDHPCGCRDGGNGGAG